MEDIMQNLAIVALSSDTIMKNVLSLHTTIAYVVICPLIYQHRHTQHAPCTHTYVGVHLNKHQQIQRMKNKNNKTYTFNLHLTCHTQSSEINMAILGLWRGVFFSLHFTHRVTNARARCTFTHGSNVMCVRVPSQTTIGLAVEWEKDVVPFENICNRSVSILTAFCYSWNDRHSYAAIHAFRICVIVYI